MSYDRSDPVPDERDEADSPTGAHPDSRDRDAAEDLELGAAVGRALRERHGPVRAAPPVSLIEERADARARARAARRALAGVAAVAALIVGGVAAWNMLDGDGSGTVVVSPDDPEAGDDEAAAADGSTAPAAAAEPDGEAGGPVPGQEADGPAAAPEAGSETGGTPGAADPPGAEDAQPADLDKPTPGELSTGPVLQWTEIEPGIDDLARIESVGDGRIIARTWRDTGSTGNTYVAGKVVVTTNGTDWADVPMPAGVVPDHIDISGDRWLVAGPEAGSDPFDRTPGRAFFSDDEGANWTELALGLPPGPAPASPYVIESTAVTSALVSGKNIVLVVSSGRSLDLYELVKGRGLVPEGKSVVVWHSSHSGLIEFELDDHGGTSGSISWFEDGSSLVAVERMPLTYDELGLTDEERAVFDDLSGGRVLVYASDGPAVDLVAEYESWAWPGVATDQGFVLKVGGVRETIVTSRDGRAWSEQTPSWTGSSMLTLAPDGTIWMFDSGGPGLSIQRARYGETPTTAATFEDLQRTGDLAAGPAGLITTAAPLAAPEADLAAGIPEGRVAKGGYELRYNEPEGGVTLWDLDAGAAVYVFEAADIMSEEPLQGVHEVSSGDGLQVVFEDPETGADLVTFTAEDLASIFMPAVDGSAAPLTSDGYEPPEMWVGWSADGTFWGWQPTAKAFGIDDGELWAEFAVGGDFVLARVQTIEVQVPEALGPDGEPAGILTIEDPDAFGSVGGQASNRLGGSVEPQPPRWFIARVP